MHKCHSCRYRLTWNLRTLLHNYINGPGHKNYWVCYCEQRFAYIGLCTIRKLIDCNEIKWQNWCGAVYIHFHWLVWLLIWYIVLLMLVESLSPTLNIYSCAWKTWTVVTGVYTSNISRNSALHVISTTNILC